MKKAQGFLKDHKEICGVLIAVVFSNLLFFNQRNWQMNPVYIAAVSIVIYLGVRQMYRQRDFLREARVLQGVLTLSVLFSAMIVAGGKIEVENKVFHTFSLVDMFWFFFYIILGCLLFFNIFVLSESGKVHSFCREKTGSFEFVNKRTWLIYSLILAAAWIPVFFCYYPGIMPEDASCSIAMAGGQLPWTNQFPVFYSLMIGAFILVGYCLNNLNLGIALYSVFQLTLMAGGLGFFLFWLQKKGLKRTYIYFTLAYFSAAPMFGNYAIVMWKDPLFSLLLLIMGIFLFEHVAQNKETFLEKRNLILYAGLLFLICLMRTNGIYIGLLLNLCLMIIYRRQLRKLILPLIGSLLLAYILTGPVYIHFFSAETMFEETVGVPLQQMARTVAEDGDLSDSDREFLDQLLPLEKYKEYYNPFLVDPVKWVPEFDSDFLETHKREFFETWGSMLTKNFGRYVEQYLMGTYGFWHIGGDTNYEFAKEDVTENTWDMYQTRPWENLLDYPMKETLSPKYDYIATGLLIWIMLVDMGLCWMKKKSIYMVPLLIVVGNWLTLMVATPTAFGVRYVFVSVLAFPLLLAYPWMIPKKEESYLKKTR